jgi:phenylpropionate dioxygenase-like ring-hydroxylating dioxygenase large terminal subunit
MEQLSVTNKKSTIPQTMPYRLFTQPEVLVEEQQKVFSKSWQFVGHVSQLINTGDYITCDVAGKPILIIRGDDGQIRAFYNVCPHRGTKLVNEEQGQQKILTCMYHGWSFKLDGQLNKAPNFKDSPDLCSHDICLHDIRVESVSSLVFVNLDPHAKTLQSEYEEFFNDLSRFTFLEDLKKYSVNTRVIKCNWKVFIDNFLECDHCPIAHPGFSATLDLSKYHIINGSNCNIQGTSLKEKKSRQTLNLELQQADVQEGRFYWLWPNVMFTVYPGPSNISAIQMIPIDHETTLAVYTYYLKNDEPTEEQKIQMEFTEQVRREDIDLVELAQIGLSSNAFPRGLLSPTEHGLLHFHLMVQNILEISDEQQR